MLYECILQIRFYYRKGLNDKRLQIYKAYNYSLFFFSKEYCNESRSQIVYNDVSNPELKLGAHHFMLIANRYSTHRKISL